MKLIILLFGLAVGFGGGIYWGVHHPEQASGIAAEEEKKFIEMQLKASEAIKQKLDQIANSQSSQPAGGRPGSGFVSGGSAPTSTDKQVDSARTEQDRQIQQLRDRLNQLNGK